MTRPSSCLIGDTSRSTSLLRLTARAALALPLAALLYASSAFAAVAPSLGTADGFAVLAGTAVTCTASEITGDAGVSPGTAFTQTGCDVSGTIHVADAVAQQAQSDFLAAYADLAGQTCDTVLTGTLSGLTLTPGVYCFTAAATLTGVLTLDAQGDPNAVWIFKVGTGGTGALTATSLSVVTVNGAQACNVYWWVADAATITTSSFAGTVLAGAAITITSSGVRGDALTRDAVTLTATSVVACAQGGVPPRSRCNQGVGNGPEGCDPGNSNQGNPARSNDELGGTPGNPGRKGGNK